MQLDQDNASSETSEQQPPKREQSAPPSDPLKLLSEALKRERAGDTQQSDDDGESQDERDDGGKPPARSSSKSKLKAKDLNALAETLGVEVSDLYAVEIPSSKKGEKPFTLGKLKDLATQHGEFTVSRLRLDEDRRKFESEQIRAENELNEVLKYLPADAIKPEQLQKLRNRLAQRHAAERELVLEKIPEWQNEDTRNAELKSMVEHLASHGIPEAFLLHNFSLRLVKYVREAWRLETSVRKALEQVEERKPTTPPKARSAPPKKNGKAPPPPSSRMSQNVASFMDTIRNAATNRGD